MSFTSLLFGFRLVVVYLPVAVRLCRAWPLGVTSGCFLDECLGWNLYAPLALVLFGDLDQLLII